MRRCLVDVLPTEMRGLLVLLSRCSLMTDTRRELGAVEVGVCRHTHRCTL